MWHLTNFEPSEVIEFAMQIEKKGVEFYQKLSQKTEQEKIKELLLFLAAEEEKHFQDFNNFGKGFDYFQPRETYSGEYLDYLNSAVDNHLFQNPEKLGELTVGIQSELDLVKLAASLEKDTILFYQSFRGLIRAEKLTVIDNLIKEEQSHLIKLNKIKIEIEEGRI